jgi:hypothetical protein
MIVSGMNRRVAEASDANYRHSFKISQMKSNRDSG